MVAKKKVGLALEELRMGLISEGKGVRGDASRLDAFNSTLISWIGRMEVG